MLPPSVESRIFTAWQFTEPALVPFTAQVTVALPPAGQVMAVLLGELTWKGPAVLVTVTTTSVNAVCPTATGAVELKGWLSLTVRRKFNVLDTLLSALRLAQALMLRQSLLQTAGNSGFTVA